MEDQIEKVLALTFSFNCTNEQTTVRDYLRRLLLEVWNVGEGFSGKRPFGNSGWQYDLYAPLVKAGIINGKVDEDGYLNECDEKAGHQMIMQAIYHIFKSAQ